MNPPEEPADLDGLHDPRFAWLLTLLQERGRLLQPSSALLKEALEQCHRVSQQQRSADLTLITGDIPEPADDPRQREEPQQLPGQQALVGSEIARATTEAESPDALRRANAKLHKKTSTLAPGTILKGYRIVELLGVGGMGQVYKAIQLSLGREVAFKVLSPRYAESESFRKRFLREARAAGRLHHHNLISVHDVDEHDGRLFFSMDLVEGLSVGEHLDQQGAYDELEALHIIEQTLRALEYAHARGLVHRDIKPDNLMVTAQGVVKVADLGLSRIDDPDSNAESGATVSGAMMGTPYYMSPEQSEDAHGADARADLYSVGATLYHMVVGEVPFKGDNPVSVVVNATTLPLRFPPDALPSAPLRRLIERFMAKAPHRRPQQASEALRELQRCRERLTKPAGFFRSRSAVATALLLLLMLVVAVRYYRQGKVERLAQLEERVEQLLVTNDFEQAQALVQSNPKETLTPEELARLQEIREKFLAEWDRYALQALSSSFALVEADLHAGRPAEAKRRLQRILRQPRWLSPAVRKRLDSYQEAMQTAR